MKAGTTAAAESISVAVAGVGVGVGVAGAGLEFTVVLLDVSRKLAKSAREVRVVGC